MNELKFNFEKISISTKILFVSRELPGTPGKKVKTFVERIYIRQNFVFTEHENMDNYVRTAKKYG